MIVFYNIMMLSVIFYLSLILIVMVKVFEFVRSMIEHDFSTCTFGLNAAHDFRNNLNFGIYVILIVLL